MTQFVLPWLQARLQWQEKAPYLLGFSKSGWGALSLLLRNPTLFSGAAVWDAPLVMSTPAFGSTVIFPTNSDVAAYAPWNLITQPSVIGLVRTYKHRIVLMGYKTFRADMQEFHYRALDAALPHSFIEQAEPTHSWNGAWVFEIVERILS